MKKKKLVKKKSPRKKLGRPLGSRNAAGKKFAKLVDAVLDEIADRKQKMNMDY